MHTHTHTHMHTHTHTHTQDTHTKVRNPETRRKPHLIILGHLTTERGSPEQIPNWRPRYSVSIYHFTTRSLGGARRQ